jgi:hypothetical protein
MTESSGADAELPPVPDEIREAGRLAPDHWFGMIDPMWSGEGRPPEWASVGRWRSGLDGEIEEWEDNPEYRPSPSAMGWPEPEDEVDRAVQLAATGYGPGEAVAQALVGREVAVLTSPSGGPLSAMSPEGTPVVPLFTSPVFLHATGRLAFEMVGVNDLVGQVPEGHALYLNPSGPVAMTLEPHVVRAAIQDGVRERPVATAGGDTRTAVQAAPVVSSGQAVQAGQAVDAVPAATVTVEGGSQPRGTDA